LLSKRRHCFLTLTGHVFFLLENMFPNNFSTPIYSNLLNRITGNYKVAEGGNEIQFTKTQSGLICIVCTFGMPKGR